METWMKNRSGWRGGKGATGSPLVEHPPRYNDNIEGGPLSEQTDYAAQPAVEVNGTEAWSASPNAGPVSERVDGVLPPVALAMDSRPARVLDHMFPHRGLADPSIACDGERRWHPRSGRKKGRDLSHLGIGDHG